MDTIVHYKRLEHGVKPEMDDREKQEFNERARKKFEAEKARLRQNGR